MSSVRINQYIDTPLGTLHIYSDPGRAERAEKLIKETPALLFEAYRDAAQRYGKDILNRAFKCVMTSTPPKGVSWPPLSSRYARRKQGDTSEASQYYDTGFYARNIGIFTEKLHYPKAFAGIRTGARVYIGLPNGVYHPKAGANRYSKRGPLTLQKIAKILEQGSGDGNIPARPLWRPLYQAYGGNAKLKKVITEAIRRQVRKYT